MSYADKLMTMASEAEEQAELLLAKNAASGLDRDDLIRRAAFHQGRASGYRQAAFYITTITEENPHD